MAKGVPLPTEPLSENFDEAWSRLCAAAMAKNDSDLARTLGIGPSSVAGAKKRRQIPPAWVLAVSAKFHKSMDWIVWGDNPEELSLEASFGPKEERQKNVCACCPHQGMADYLEVLKVKARVSAGTGSLETSGEEDGRYAFREAWIRSKGNPKTMRLMDVTGDSMEPELRHKDMILVDESQTEIISGGVYVVGMGEEVVVKYVDRLPGKWQLRSANPCYAPIEIDLSDESLQVRIIGRVVWWCREAR